jgi:energy-coupling factor transport system permease protein
MVKLGLPYNLGMTIGLALNYLGTVGDLYTTVSDAQQARGWDLSQRGLIKRARAAVPTLIAVIIASLRLSDTLALGLAARGFGLARPRTIYHDICMTRFDWATAALITLAFAALLYIILQTS